MAKPSRYKSDKVSSSSVSKKITTSSSAIQSVFGVDANQQIEDINVYNILKANGIYDRDDIKSYSKFNRFGFFDPYNKVTQTKEYLFFTKPDCHIFNPGTVQLQNNLKSDPFFIDLAARYPYVVQQLQSSAGSLSGQASAFTKSPFMNLLTNSVKGTLDLPTLNATEMEGPSNAYGTHIDYRKDAWTGDENVEFSLEFEDTKYIELFMLFRAYEEYERYKTVGLIYPPDVGKNTPKIEPVGHMQCKYIKEKTLHDVFGIYKFIVDDTYENIMYYAYVCGAFFKSVPRDAFNDLKQGDGLSYTVDFKAYKVIDMNPIILSNFNRVVQEKYTAKNKTFVPIYNRAKKRMNGNWVKCPLVVRVNTSAGSKSPKYLGAEGMSYVYKLKWFQ